MNLWPWLNLFADTTTIIIIETERRPTMDAKIHTIATSTMRETAIGTTNRTIVSSMTSKWWEEDRGRSLNEI